MTGRVSSNQMSRPGVRPGVSVIMDAVQQSLACTALRSWP